MIKRRLRTGFTADYIAEIIAQYPELVRLLYAKFADIHVKPQERSFDYVPPAPPVEMLSDAQLKDLISRTVSNDYELMVMEAFTVFNSVVLKTNYYTPTKMALSFRLDPKFLLEHQLRVPWFPSSFQGHRPRRHSNRQVSEPRGLLNQRPFYVRRELWPSQHSAEQEQRYP